MSERVWVIGGTSGMGQATARILADQGYLVVVTGRSYETVKKSVEALGAPRVEGKVVDFTRDAGVEALSQGPVDHLVLVGSGAPRRGAVDAVTVGDARLAWEEKFVGYLRCVQAALPVWNPRGSLTVVSGGAARAAVPGTSLVAAVNGALQSWARTLVKELAPRRVNVVSPGIIDTPLHDWLDPRIRAERFAALAAGLPGGRMGQPDDVARAIAFLVASPFVTGALVDVDGGLRLK
jgi:NAD(P)-dependent dehydrogenase (short-subunit alcohol dehydrogenase family)